MPAPDDAKLSSPGRAFASCTRSFIDFAGSDKGTITSIGAEAIRLTGAKSFIASYGGLCIRFGLMP